MCVCACVLVTAQPDRCGRVGNTPENPVVRTANTGSQQSTPAEHHSNNKNLQENQHVKKDSVPEIFTWKEGMRKVNNSKTNTENPIVADNEYKPENPIIADNK